MTNFREGIENEPEFVITVPEGFSLDFAHETKARMTIGVIIQLIAQAEKYVIISAPFIQKVVSDNKTELHIAIQSALNRGVQVNVLSTSTSISILRDSAFMNHSNIHYYVPKRNLENEKSLGSHAKFCLVDGKHVYIGSANVTGPGLYGNLEMGILLHGKIATQVENFWTSLIEKDFLVKLS